MNSEKLLKMNNGFGPIAEKRENRSYYAMVVFGAAVIVLHLLYRVCFGVKPLKHFLFEDTMNAAEILSAVITGEMIRRGLLYVEEYHHVNERYLGSKTEALKSCMTFPDRNAIILLIWFITSFWYIYGLATNGQNLLFPYYIIVVIISSVWMHVLGLRGLSEVELSAISEKEISNVAFGLAWSYYYGYLKLILPIWDTMLEKAVSPAHDVEGEDKRDKLASKKLFIVMPKNCYCYRKFDDIDINIKYHSSMPEFKYTRGGVQERVYKSTLYKIQRAGSAAQYVMMEYATPLLSLYDMKNDANVAFFKEKDLNQQVVIFYKTLKEILEGDPECKGNYELVLVSDEHENLADIIQQTIAEERLNI